VDVEHPDLDVYIQMWMYTSTTNISDGCFNTNDELFEKAFTATQNIAGHGWSS
tara:strand:+ start:45 stop:203 length:159 start_codon:yes stop_codon:yes gene_type:complete